MTLGLCTSYNLIAQEEAFTPPTDIQFKQQKKKEWKISSDQDLVDDALMVLFPAPMDEGGLGYEDWKTPAYWSCTTCPKQQFLDYNNSDDSSVPLIHFPFEINYTISVGELAFTYNKHNYKLACFSTAESNDGTGRFVSGVLGLALIEQKKGVNIIRDFNPAVNFQGSFTNVDPPTQVFKTATGFYFIGKGGLANGVSVEDYWPIFSDLFVYSQELKQVLRVHHAFCDLNCEQGSNWKTELKSIETAKSGIEICTETTGVLLKDGYWEAPEILDSIQIDKRIIEAEMLRFKINTNYVVTNEGAIIETHQVVLENKEHQVEKFTFTTTHKTTL